MSDDVKMSFDEWKQRFDEADKKVTVDWDSGHCYTILEGAPDIEWCEDPDSAQDICSEYESSHGPELYCVPEVINQLVGQHVNVECGQCWHHLDDDEKIERVQGFISLVETERPKSYQWYRIDLLKKWVLIEVTKKVLRS